MVGVCKEGATFAWQVGLYPPLLGGIAYKTEPENKINEKKIRTSYSEEYSLVAHGRGPPPKRPLRFKLGLEAPPGAESAHPPV